VNAKVSSTLAGGLRVFLAGTILGAATTTVAQTVQEHVHAHGQDVMPFDLGKTVHVFRMTSDGGTQKVVLREAWPDPEQVRLIQHHLSTEAAEFQKGNFADPAHLHGAHMPGLRELQAGARRVQITYRALSDGGEIRFRTRDIDLVTAVHRWFGAQLSEHGADAKSE
jgi:hypothetical protein